MCWAPLSSLHPALDGVDVTRLWQMCCVRKSSSTKTLQITCFGRIKGPPPSGLNWLLARFIQPRSAPLVSVQFYSVGAIWQCLSATPSAFLRLCLLLTVSVRLICPFKARVIQGSKRFLYVTPVLLSTHVSSQDQRSVCGAAGAACARHINTVQNLLCVPHPALQLSNRTSV